MDTKPMHTPGPWKLGADYAITGDGHTICRIGRHKNNSLIVSTEDAANARLIAAAPELLEKLKNARYMLLRLCWSTQEEIEAIDAVIAKAKGQENA